MNTQSVESMNIGDKVEVFVGNTILVVECYAACSKCRHLPQCQTQSYTIQEKIGDKILKTMAFSMTPDEVIEFLAKQGVEYGTNSRL